MAAWLLLALLAGSLVYCVLVLVAAVRYRGKPLPDGHGSVTPKPLTEPRPSGSGNVLPISVLKPLYGRDDGLEENLRSFFTQRYPGFEILMAVRQESDEAVPIVRRLQAEFPSIPSRLLITGEPPYPNAKVFSLQCMTDAARFDLLVMSDSDVRATPDMLAVLAAEFANPRIGVSTCPYRAVGGPSPWSRLEAVGMNTEFISGVLVARMLEGMKFALGPTITARKQVIAALGGWDYLKDFLAEDFVLGKKAAELGHEVILSAYVIEHRIGSQPFGKNMAHRLRWARSTRRSRPAGYVGQLFTNPLPIALMLAAVQPEWWWMLAITIALRFLIAWVTAVWVLRARMNWLLLPLQDVLSFVFWLAGFFGNVIVWRSRRYYLRPDGRFELIS